MEIAFLNETLEMCHQETSAEDIIPSISAQYHHTSTLVDFQSSIFNLN